MAGGGRGGSSSRLVAGIRVLRVAQPCMIRKLLARAGRPRAAWHVPTGVHAERSGFRGQLHPEPGQLSEVPQAGSQSACTYRERRHTRAERWGPPGSRMTASRTTRAVSMQISGLARPTVSLLAPGPRPGGTRLLLPPPASSSTQAGLLTLKAVLGAAYGMSGHMPLAPPPLLPPRPSPAAKPAMRGILCLMP